jgi:hypothetical protein
MKPFSLLSGCAAIASLAAAQKGGFGKGKGGGGGKAGGKVNCQGDMAGGLGSLGGDGKVD